MNTDYITASELSDYVYCECCWADKQEGEYQETAEMLAGVKAHDRLQWSYQLVQFIKQVSLIVVVGSIILLFLFVIVLFLSGGLS